MEWSSLQKVSEFILRKINEFNFWSQSKKKNFLGKFTYSFVSWTILVNV